MSFSQQKGESILYTISCTALSEKILFTYTYTEQCDSYIGREGATCSFASSLYSSLLRYSTGFFILVCLGVSRRSRNIDTVMHNNTAQFCLSFVSALLFSLRTLVPRVSSLSIIPLFLLQQFASNHHHLSRNKNWAKKKDWEFLWMKQDNFVYNKKYRSCVWSFIWLSSLNFIQNERVANIE